MSQPSEIKLLPAYSIAAAARFVDSNPSTLRAWFRGRDYTVGGQTRHSSAILSASTYGKAISFIDLVEAHVLTLVRREYHIPMKNVKAAAETLRKLKGNLTFLAHKDFFFDRKHLFLEIGDKLVSLSERGQHVDRQIISEGLKQLNYGTDGFASQFYPAFRGVQQKDVFLDPEINFGRPCLAALGVSVNAMADRFFAGEAIENLAEDYGATKQQVETALRWHDLQAA